MGTKKETVDIDKDYVKKSLLMYNYFPMQRKEKEEMPPILTSVDFKPEVASKIKGSSCGKRNKGFDSIEYRLTRFNGVSRICTIPHPKPYSDLVFCIAENWDKLNYIIENKNSLIRPKKHNGDDRIIIMNYEDKTEKTKKKLDMAFGCRFMVYTDISNFFPSLYTHTLCWTDSPIVVAKQRKSPLQKIDDSLQELNRCETHGVAIGPATSNIVSEAILAKIDEDLCKKYNYERYIDDYTAYCKTEEDAQKFIKNLSAELNKYRLSLNINKTKIVALPTPYNDDWVTELLSNQIKDDKISVRDVTNYVSLLINLSQKAPDGSVLKFGLKCLINKLNANKIQHAVSDETVLCIFKNILNLSFYQPILLPLLNNEHFNSLIQDHLGNLNFKNKFGKILTTNIEHHRSDAVSWTLYYHYKYKIPVSDTNVKKIIETKDCIPMLILYFNSKKEKVINFANDIIKNSDKDSDLYELDRYWLLLYELFRMEEINNPYGKNNTFDILKNQNVSFMKLDNEERK